MTLHVVGNLCFDITLVVPRFPIIGETMAALGSRSGLGGKGVNQAVAAARAGADVVLHAAAGEADLDMVSRLLASEHRLTLRLSGLSLPSDTSTILVRQDGENMIVSDTQCARAFDPMKSGFADRLAPGDVLLMQGNLGLAATSACLGEGRRRAAFTVLNPSPLWADGHPAWHHVDCLVVNAGELAGLGGEADLERAADRLLAEGVGALAVTLGRAGAFYVDATQRFDVTAPSVEVCDTTGAGDVFCGVLAALMARGLADALARASAAASLSVTRPGALASCPSAAELDGLSLTSWTRRLR